MCPPPLPPQESCNSASVLYACMGGGGGFKSGVPLLNNIVSSKRDGSPPPIFYSTKRPPPCEDQPPHDHVFDRLNFQHGHVQFCMIRRFLQDILRPGFRIAAHFASTQPGCLHQFSLESVMLGCSPAQAAKRALVVLLRALEAKRLVPGKTAYKARVQNFLRSRRAQAVAAKFAASMKSVRRAVIKAKVARTKH